MAAGHNTAPVHWQGGQAINGTFDAATHISHRLRVSSWETAAFQWVKTASDSAVVSSIDFYGTIAPIDSVLAELNWSDDDPTAGPWAALSGVGFMALPTTAVGRSEILSVPVAGISMLLVRMIVATEATGLSLLFGGR